MSDALCFVAIIPSNKGNMDNHNLIGLIGIIRRFGHQENYMQLQLNIN